MFDKNKLSYWASNNVVQISFIIIAVLLVAFIVYGFDILDEPEAIDIQPL